jgi:hypothetical protein
MIKFFKVLSLFMCLSVPKIYQKYDFFRKVGLTTDGILGQLEVAEADEAVESYNIVFSRQRRILPLMRTATRKTRMVHLRTLTTWAKGSSHLRLSWLFMMTTSFLI